MTNSNNQLVRVSNNRLVTTSFDVSNHFGKKHKNVLQAIENLECSQEFAGLNFQLCYKISELQNGKRLPYYEITRDGFVFLCMGFTGAQAAAWKEKYIAAFNELERQLSQNTQLNALKTAYLASNPDAQKLLRYVDLGLNHVEIGKLLDVSGQTVRDRLKKLASCGLCDYTPNPKYQHTAHLADNHQAELALEA